MGFKFSVGVMTTTNVKAVPRRPLGRLSGISRDILAQMHAELASELAIIEPSYRASAGHRNGFWYVDQELKQRVLAQAGLSER